VDAVASFCVADCAIGAEIEGFGCAVTVHDCFLCLIEKDMDSGRVNREREKLYSYVISSNDAGW